MPDCIAETSGAARQDRFAVYRNNVVQGLVEALETRFPAVRQSVGETFFAAAARIYATRHPPRTPIMALYGADFPVFLARFGLRMKPDLKTRLESAAQQSGRSMNSEIISRLEATFAPEDAAQVPDFVTVSRPDELEKEFAALKERMAAVEKKG